MQNMLTCFLLVIFDSPNYWKGTDDGTARFHVCVWQVWLVKYDNKSQHVNRCQQLTEVITSNVWSTCQSVADVGNTYIIFCIMVIRSVVLVVTGEEYWWERASSDFDFQSQWQKGASIITLELGDRVDNIDSLRVKDTQRFSSAALKDTIMKRGVLCYPPVDSDHVLYPRTYSLFPQITRTSSGTSHSQESPWKQNETNTEGSFTY